MNRKKFQVGEKIFDNSKGEGEVVGYEYNHLFGDEEYVVKWSRDGKEECVEQILADKTWSYIIDEPISLYTPPKDKLPLPKSMQLSINGNKIKPFYQSGIQSINVNVKVSDIKFECSHKHQIDVGFMFTKMVCKDCNKEIKS